MNDSVLQQCELGKLMRRKTANDYHDLAAERRLTWCGPEVQSTQKYTSWTCSEGHLFYRPYGEIRRGHGCSVCGRQKAIQKSRKQPEDYRALAQAKQWTWLGPKVSTATTSTRWRCERGHIVESSYAGMKKGRKCGECNTKRRTANDYEIMAGKLGWKWLGPEVKRIADNTNWRCDKGHNVAASFKQLYHQARGCRLCGIQRRADNRRFGPQYYEELAKEQGWTWLGSDVFDTHTHTTWQCPYGHEIQATYTEVRRGRKCEQCRAIAIKNDPSIVPNKRYGPIEYNALARSRSYKWLGPIVPRINTKTNWLCPNDHKFSMTYGAMRGGQGCRICNTKAAADRRRYGPDQYRLLASVRDVEWLGPEIAFTYMNTTWRCKLGHDFDMTYNSLDQGQGCSVCGGSAPKTTEDYYELAKQKGIHWLGDHPENTKTRTKWRCELGHDFDSTYQDVRSAKRSGCDICAQVYRSESVRKTAQDYEKLAENHDLKFIGPFPTEGAQSDTTWECNKGHRWDTSYSSIRSGSGCHICARKSQADSHRFGQSQYHRLAKKRGFKWEGPEVKNTWTKTFWTCKNKHTFEATYNFVQADKGCATCIDVVNGAKVSQIQRTLCDLLDGELNKNEGRLKIDVALEIGGTKIAVEYDAWYWHGDHLDQDARRDSRLIEKGWNILRIRSGALLPTSEQLDEALENLADGTDHVEIVLADWGKGETRDGSIGDSL